MTKSSWTVPQLFCYTLLWQFHLIPCSCNRNNNSNSDSDSPIESRSRAYNHNRWYELLYYKNLVLSSTNKVIQYPTRRSSKTSKPQKEGPIAAKFRTSSENTLIVSLEATVRHYTEFVPHVTSLRRWKKVTTPNIWTQQHVPTTMRFVVASRRPSS